IRPAPASFEEAWKRPCMAILSASVPEAVKITSIGSQPSSSATVSRASSNTDRALRPEAYCAPAFNMPEALTHASIADWRMGWVAASSKYDIRRASSILRRVLAQIHAGQQLRRDRRSGRKAHPGLG